MAESSYRREQFTVITLAAQLVTRCDDTDTAAAHHRGIIDDLLILFSPSLFLFFSSTWLFLLSALVIGFASFFSLPPSLMRRLLTAVSR